MLNLDKSPLSNNQIPESCILSIILSTQSRVTPACKSPERVKEMIPKEIPSEIIVIHYNQGAEVDSDRELNSSQLVDEPNKLGNVHTGGEKNGIVHIIAKGKFSSAIMKGIESSTGKYILVMDADFPYPDELVPNLINKLIGVPNSIIVASMYAKGIIIQNLPFMRGTISKLSRIIVRHGLKVTGVEDPLSGCFAISRQLVQRISIEGKGDELLLEILVKLNTSKKDNKITVIEVPFSQKGEQPTTRKLDFSRIASYSKAVWHLYRYGRTSRLIQTETDIIQQKKHKSVLFLSKAARFFTVGASGLVVNYLVSLFLSNLIPNIWYIHATLFGIVISITSNFLLNKIWTFEDRDFSPRHFLRQYALFLALCTLGAVIQLSLVYVFVEFSQIHYAVSLIMAVCIASLSNFLLNKKITFGEKIWE